MKIKLIAFIAIIVALTTAVTAGYANKYLTEKRIVSHAKDYVTGIFQEYNDVELVDYEQHSPGGDGLLCDLPFQQEIPAFTGAEVFYGRKGDIYCLLTYADKTRLLVISSKEGDTIETIN